jgi:molybdopterin-guanine dinucleotide biosynthesis adapter protein
MARFSPRRRYDRRHANAPARRARPMKVFGIAGFSGMGKTTLLERLIPELKSRGLRVSLIKHSHKAIEIDRPGKDSYRLREAGCQEVLLLGDGRWALMHELRGAPEPDLDYLLSRLQHCDLVLVEGFKSGAFPKLEVWRSVERDETLWPNWPGITAIACDEADAVRLAARPGAPLCVPLHDTAALAELVCAQARAL